MKLATPVAGKVPRNRITLTCGLLKRYSNIPESGWPVRLNVKRAAQSLHPPFPGRPTLNFRDALGLVPLFNPPRQPRGDLTKGRGRNCHCGHNGSHSAQFFRSSIGVVEMPEKSRRNYSALRPMCEGLKAATSCRTMGCPDNSRNAPRCAWVAHNWTRPGFSKLNQGTGCATGCATLFALCATSTR